MIPMKKVITYGTFDLLHHGHINLLKRAKELGDYLIVGVTSTDFDANRGKLNVKQSLMERIEAVKATGIADEVIPEEYEGQKIDDIRSYDVDIFAIGSDWRGYFDYLNEYCDVVYLDRTQGISSTQLRDEEGRLYLGIIGSSSDIEKFIAESLYVSGVEISGVFTDTQTYQMDVSVPYCNSLDELLSTCNAVYIANDPRLRYEVARKALEAGKHVLCESPVSLTEQGALDLFEEAAKNNLVFQEAIKTAYALAFSRLVLLVKSGRIGEVVSIKSTCTSLARPSLMGSMVGWGPIASLPIFSLLGTDYKEARATSLFKDAEGSRTDVFTKVDFLFEKACASFEVGSNVKSEGDLVIAGTRGYIYVPSPWWKTDYFEIRFEDFSENKRFFYQLAGEGIRNELASFTKAIRADKKPNFEIPTKQTVAFSRLIQDYVTESMPVASLGTLSCKDDGQKRNVTA